MLGTDLCFILISSLHVSHKKTSNTCIAIHEIFRKQQDCQESAKSKYATINAAMELDGTKVGTWFYISTFVQFSHWLTDSLIAVIGRITLHLD